MTAGGRLLGDPHRFDFFQALRLLERMELERDRGATGDRKGRVGEDLDPSREVVRLRAAEGSTFPSSAVAWLQETRAQVGKGRSRLRLEMAVSFLGLTGPLGVLPRHYTRLLLEQAREKDSSFRDFLDLFNHRLISFFFRAWEKYRFPTAYERSRLDPSAKEDLFTASLFSLLGLGTGGLRGRLDVEDEALLIYSGILADTRRTPISLERVLSDEFGIPVKVSQFRGRWLPMDGSDRSSLSSPGAGGGNNLLGANAVLGERVWEVQSSFRVTLGPLTFDLYRRFLPTGSEIVALSQLIRLSAGPDLDFEIQPSLEASEIPPLLLAEKEGYEPRLGWTTWLVSGRQAKDFEGPVFEPVES